MAKDPTQDLALAAQLVASSLSVDQFQFDYAARSPTTSTR